MTKYKLRSHIFDAFKITVENNRDFVNWPEWLKSKAFYGLIYIKTTDILCIKDRYGDEHIIGNNCWIVDKGTSFETYTDNAFKKIFISCDIIENR